MPEKFIPASIPVISAHHVQVSQLLAVLVHRAGDEVRISADEINTLVDNKINRISYRPDKDDLTIAILTLLPAKEELIQGVLYGVTSEE